MNGRSPVLKSIPGPVDIVQVFRSPEAAIEIAAEAAVTQPKIFWLQEGVVSEKAASIAKDAGLQVVHNRCTYKEAQRQEAQYQPMPVKSNQSIKKRRVWT